MDVTRSMLSLFSIFLGFTFPIHTTLKGEIQTAPNEVSAGITNKSGRIQALELEQQQNTASTKAAGIGNLLLVSRW